MSTISAEPATQDVAIGRERLEGILARPGKARGLVIFAHGTGSSRFSLRNVEVARQLHAQELATLLFDLLTEHEAYDRRNVFDVTMLGGRMVDAVRFVLSDPELSRLPIGLFGASTGAAAALVAAAKLPQDVSAVVSRGGRPDLAGGALPHVRAATLLIVGGNDNAVLKLNRRAFDTLTCEKRLDIVPGATHLFEEPGALDKVVELAGDWFNSHFDAIAT
jgi:pimeloyl-ACP methyl ester carboxylesterase